MTNAPIYIAYHDGVWKPTDQCLVPINCHALQYGTGCFEGIRGYWSGSRINLLFLREHLQRLSRSAHVLLMEVPPVDKLISIAQEVVRRNRPTQNIYLRPMMYKSGTGLAPIMLNVPDAFMCYMIALGDFLDTSKGLEVCVSSWLRLPDNAIPTRTKATGGYLNSSLAKSEAVLNGYDEAIFLNDRGQVCEGSAENIFIVRDGMLHTPDRTADILEGITRAAIIQLAKDLGIAVQERAIARTELYVADEIFLVGTGCQVSWVRSVDKRTISSCCGPLTARIQQAYENAVYERDSDYASWLTPVDA